MDTITIPPTMPATVYVRWSSEAQTGRDSLRRQLEAAERYAGEHRLQIVETIIDEAVSAFSGDHLTKGRLGEFIGRVRNGKLALPHVLLFESLDRLNRQAPLDAIAPFTTLINAGVTLVTLSDQQQFTRDTMSRDGGLKLLGSLIVMLRAHEESATKSQRVRAAWERKRRDVTSAKLTMICPAWLLLRADRSGFEVIEDRAEVVRTILRETAAGIGKAKVAARLNERGIRPFGRGDGWHPSYVQKVLASDATRGFYQPHILRDGRRQPCGEPVPDYFPRIADDGLVMRARAAIVSRRRGRGGRTGAEFPNLLQGIGRCADCGGVMVGVSKGGGERYLACAAARRSHRCESRTLFNLPEAERVFSDAVHAIDPSQDSFDHSSSADLLRARQEEARLSSRLTALLTAFGSDATAEITNAIADAREALSLARSQTARFTEAVLVETYGARLADVRDAVSALRASEGAALPSQDVFLLRARVAHAARAASLSAIFQRGDRTVALLQEGRIISDRFSCTPTRSKPQRDPLGRFAERPPPGS